ncbi:MAG TPA: sugar phosphate isomerase/epimerase family protein [Bacillota bacterium]|nr:sugar phosphate isomerase/epimerase family protein [Bacillota bacterium]
MQDTRYKLAYMVATPDILSPNSLGYHGEIDYSCSLLKELGYDGIELTTAEADAFSWKPIEKAVEKYGLDVPLVCTGEVFGQSAIGLVHPDEGKRRLALERIKRIVDFASIWGAHVNIGRSRWHYEEGIPREQTEKWALEAFKELSDYAARFDVTIALEPIASHVLNFINSTQDGLDWMARVNKPNFLLMLDVYHMNIEDRLSMEKSIKQAVSLDAVAHVHLCDTNRKPPGYGHMDFEGVINAFKRAGYRGYLSAEVFNYPNQESAIRRTIQVLKPLL